MNNISYPDRIIYIKEKHVNRRIESIEYKIEWTSNGTISALSCFIIFLTETI